MFGSWELIFFEKAKTPTKKNCDLETPTKKICDLGKGGGSPPGVHFQGRGANPPPTEFIFEKGGGVPPPEFIL